MRAKRESGSRLSRLLRLSRTAARIGAAICGDAAGRSNFASRMSRSWQGYSKAGQAARAATPFRLLRAGRCHNAPSAGRRTRACSRNLLAPIALDRALTGVVMSTVDDLSRAAECLLLAIETAEPHEQRGMLELAQVWLQRSERTKNGSTSARDVPKPQTPTQLPTREGSRRKKRRRADVARAVGARGAERPWPRKTKRPR